MINPALAILEKQIRPAAVVNPNLAAFMTDKEIITAISISQTSLGRVMDNYIRNNTIPRLIPREVYLLLLNPNYNIFIPPPFQIRLNELLANWQEKRNLQALATLDDSTMTPESRNILNTLIDYTIPKV